MPWLHLIYDHSLHNSGFRLQLYLLASPAGKHSINMKLYRLTLHYSHGALTAILFPVTECLLLPFEVSTYWIQHYLLLIVPLYLLIFDDEISDDGVTYTSHEVISGSPLTKEMT